MAKKDQHKQDAADLRLRAQIECPKCGTSNPPDRMFCSGCGARLPLAEDPFANAPRPSRIKPILKHIPRLILIVLLVSLALSLWPSGRIGMEGNYRSKKFFQEKMDKLNSAVESGRDATVVVNETGVNSFLDARLQEYLEQHRFDSGTVLKSVAMMITPDSVTVQVKSEHGPLPLTRAVKGVPRIEDNNFVFEVEKVTAGILPLPPPVDSIVAKRVCRVFVRMEREREVVEELSRIQLSQGKVRLTVGGKGDEEK